MRALVFAIALLAVGIAAAPVSDADPTNPRPLDCEIQWTEVSGPEIGHAYLPTGVKCYP